MTGVECRRFHHGLTDSTNERALAAVQEGLARHGDVHVAVGQTKGRGRLGRRWESAPGEGLYLSIVLLPPVPLLPPALTIAGGLAVLDAVRRLGLNRARLEWPNDVVVAGAKLAGILVETRGLEPDRPHYVLGVGLNVSERTFPEELLRERAATSLALEGLQVSIQDAERALLADLTGRLDQATSEHGALERDFLAATGLAGRNVRVRAGETPLEGELHAFSLEHGLTLRTGAGALERVPLELIRELHAC